jgi:hypothetical protein
MTYSIEDMRDAEWDYDFEPPERDPDAAPARECPTCKHFRIHGWTEGECLCDEEDE